MNPKLRRVGVVVLLVAAAGWSWTQRHGTGVTAGATKGVTPAAAVVTAAAPDELRLGHLVLQPCPIGKHSGTPTLSAYCTLMEVSENHAESTGRRIKLKISVVRAEAAKADSDLVVFLDGGPGGAASEDYPAIANAFEPLLKRHAVLLVDQRGTGGSNALDCKSSGDGVDASGSGEGEDTAQALQSVRDCVTKLAPRAATQFYATTDAVEDLELVRHALGDPLFDLVGVSYGTRMAQQYARRYPNAVRAIVLDSAVPNDLALGSEHARNLDAVVRELFARCRADRACTGRFGDPYQTLLRVRDRLRTHPQTLELRDPYTFKLSQKTITADALAALVRLYAYSPLTAALLPYVLQEADAGRYAALLGQAEIVVGDVEDHLTGGMALSVSCAEDVDRLRSNPDDAGTILGNALIERLLLICPLWPHGTRPAKFGEPLRGPVPTLVLAGEHDPVTPVRYGQAIVGTLSRGRLIQVTGQGHAVLGTGCMPRLINEFFQTLDAAHLDTHCLDALAQTPVFVDANGAAP